jgi:hypothetical protein
VRKATLASILRKARHGIHLNEHLEHPGGPWCFRHLCKMGLEGRGRATDPDDRRTGSNSRTRRRRYSGELDVGRIYQARSGPDNLVWSWSLTVNGPMTRSNRVATLKEAKAQLLLGPALQRGRQRPVPWASRVGQGTEQLVICAIIWWRSLQG